MTGDTAGGEGEGRSHLADRYRGGSLRQAEQDGKKQGQTDRRSHLRARGVGAWSYGTLPREGDKCIYTFLVSLRYSCYGREGHALNALLPRTRTATRTRDSSAIVRAAGVSAAVKHGLTIVCFRFLFVLLP